MLRIALPKGRLAADVGALLERTPYRLPFDPDRSRKLIVDLPDRGLRYILVKPADVGIYVARGACDVGIVGKDVLEEDESDVYELLDLRVGACRLCVAAPIDWEEDTTRSLRVATKYPNVTERFYQSINRETEIIRLSGSIEVAPLLELSDVIVDLVQTGKTLEENRLVVREEIMPSSARLIANKASYRFRHREIQRLADDLQAQTEERA